MLRSSRLVGIVDGDVSWNFRGKFIVDKEGHGKRLLSSLRFNLILRSNSRQG